MVAGKFNYLTTKKVQSAHKSSSSENQAEVTLLNHAWLTFRITLRLDYNALFHKEEKDNIIQHFRIHVFLIPNVQSSPGIFSSLGCYVLSLKVLIQFQ